MWLVSLLVTSWAFNLVATLAILKHMSRNPSSSESATTVKTRIRRDLRIWSSFSLTAMAMLSNCFESWGSQPNETGDKDARWKYSITFSFQFWSTAELNNYRPFRWWKHITRYYERGVGRILNRCQNNFSPCSRFRCERMDWSDGLPIRKFPDTNISQ